MLTASGAAGGAGGAAGAGAGAAPGAAPPPTTMPSLDSLLRGAASTRTTRGASPFPGAAMGLSERRSLRKNMAAPETWPARIGRSARPEGWGGLWTRDVN
jgi:hypothetical protein